MLRLYVKDNISGNIHEYGTNQHDALILQEDGSLHYENLQNGCGTMFPDEGYTFCGADGSDPRTREDYIQYGVEPYIDIGGNGEDHATCEWISVKDRLPEDQEEVLVIVSGKSRKNITLAAAYELAEYDPVNGWILEMWPEWKGAVVTHWMPLPSTEGLE